MFVSWDLKASRYQTSKLSDGFWWDLRRGQWRHRGFIFIHFSSDYDEDACVDAEYRFHSICSSTTCVETAKWKALAMTPGSVWHLMSSALREWEHVCVQREERNERLSEREQVLEWLMADSMNGQRWIFLIKGMNFCFVSAVNNERPQHSTPSSQAPEHLMNLFQTSFSPPAANLEPLKTTEPSGNMGTICCVSAHSSLWKMRPTAAR